ncbi:MAG: BTAD domain-containing putative transcriptional regulator [Caldilineaceae bacterium]
MSHLSLGLLGAFQAHLNDQPLTGFQSDKARALLVYLAVEADHPHSRAQLAGLFWPEWPDSTARTYLRHALANLRQVLNDGATAQPFLLVTRDTLQFNLHSNHTVDVTRLNATFAQYLPTQKQTPAAETLQRLQEAVAQYQQPFLAGFYLDGCAAFEEWVLLTREQLHRQVMDALCLLADFFEQTSDFAQARHNAQRRVELEPWLEEAHRQLMRLLAQSGQRSAALAQYETCRRLLTAELGVEPSAETTALYTQIKAGRLSEGVGGWGQGARSGEQAFSPTRTSSQHNLSTPPTPLIGRAVECTAIQMLLATAEVRLITLTGPGGVGKTRVALQVAHALINQFKDGVFFVSLAPIREADLVLPTLAQTLDVLEQGSRPLLDVVKAALRERNLLLVLDNFEQVADASLVAAELLAACPALKVLITSRERLHLQGEYEYSIPPLPVPDRAASLEALFTYPSIELFRQRALAVRQDFVLNHTNAPAVAAICARLDGLPLAIELAAARVKLFAPPALLHRLTATNSHSPLHFLKADLRDAPERHRSLWETMAWSYALLATEEQCLFRRLAVFAGGCTLEAAESVCNEGLSINILDGLASLVDKHLVCQVEQMIPEAHPEPRFMLLETMREFGLAQMEQAQELAVLQQRHAAYYTKLAADLQPKLNGAESVWALAYLRQELANVRATLRWALTARQITICLKLCDTLLPFWNMGYYQEAETYLQETIVLAEGAPPSANYVHTLVSGGYVAYALGHSSKARHYFERGLAMNQTIGNLGAPPRIGIAYGMLAWIMFDQGDYQTARASLATAKKNDIATGAQWALAMTLANMGEMAAKLGDYESAAALLEDALTRHRVIGQKWGIAFTLCVQGFLFTQQGQFAQAHDALIESQTLCEALQANTLTGVKANWGLLALAQADYAKAAMFLKEALALCLELGVQRDVLEPLETLARLALCLKRPVCTLVLAGATATQRRRLESILPPPAKQVLEQAVLAARQQLDGETANIAWAKGEALTWTEAVKYALAEL